MKEDDWFKKLHASYREIEFGKIYEWINGAVAVTATDETEWNDESCMLKPYDTFIPLYMEPDETYETFLYIKILTTQGEIGTIDCCMVKTMEFSARKLHIPT
jgi:hypothetical protein